MKKVLLATLIAAMLLCCFVGCKNDDKKPGGVTTPAETTTPNDDVTTTTPGGNVTSDPSVEIQTPNPYGLGAFVSSASDDLYEYEIYENGAVVSAYKGSETTITLPTAIGETTVYGVAQNAFANSALVSVTVPNGYTVIGEGAFMSSAALTGVTLPASVKEVREDAFKFCTSIKNVALPASVEVLGAKVFYGCTALETVTLPTAITVLPDSLFFGCSSVKKVTIPASVTEIAANAFYYCTALEEAAIPASVTKIGNSAFYNCTALKNATLPEGVESIGATAFFACSSVKEVVIPATVKSIGNGAFSGCTSVESVKLPEPAYTEAEDGTKTLSNPLNMGTAVFSGCTSLKTFEIPVTVKDVPAGMFNGCTALETVTFKNDPTKFGDYAFANTALKNFQVPATVTAIGNRTFKGCTALASIELPATLKSIGIYAFESCTALTSIEIPASVVQLLEGICSGCTSLSNVTLNDGTQKIATLAFYECTSLKSVKLPGSVNDIKRYAFGCAKGKAEFQVIKPDGTTVTEILDTDYAYNKEFKIFGFTDTASSAYCTENRLAFEAIGNKGENAFEDFEYVLDEIQVPGKGTDAEGKEIDIMVPQQVVIFKKYVGTKKNVVIPTNINGAVAYKIDANCFANNKDITNVVIPAGVIEVGANAFNGCSSLAMLTVPTGVTTFGNYAFAGTAITEFKIDTATVIPDGMFSGCTALAKIDLKPTKADLAITKIGANAFEGTAITAFTIPETVTSIGSEAFLGCLTLAKVDVPDTVTELGAHALGFAKVDGKYSLIADMTYDVVTEKDKVDADGNPVLDADGNPVKETVTETFNYAFTMGYFNGAVSDTYVKNSKITGTALGNTGETAFSNFQFGEIKNESGVVIAYELKLFRSSTITEVVVPTTYNGLPVTKIAENCFAAKTSLVKVVIHKDVTVIGQNAFRAASKLAECYIYGTEVAFEYTGVFNPWNSLGAKLTIYRPENSTTAANIAAIKPQQFKTADINAVQPEA